MSFKFSRTVFIASLVGFAFGCVGQGEPQPEQPVSALVRSVGSVDNGEFAESADEEDPTQARLDNVVVVSNWLELIAAARANNGKTIAFDAPVMRSSAWTSRDWRRERGMDVPRRHPEGGRNGQVQVIFSSSHEVDGRLRNPDDHSRYAMDRYGNHRRVRLAPVVIEGGVTVELNDVVIANEDVSYWLRFPRGGGGIANGGDLTLTDCTVGGCSTLGWGGGIWNQPGGKLTLKKVEVRDNIAGQGGGIYNSPGATLVIDDNSSVQGNYATCNTWGPPPRPRVGGNLNNRFLEASRFGGGGIYNAGALVIGQKGLEGVRNNSDFVHERGPDFDPAAGPAWIRDVRPGSALRDEHTIELESARNSLLRLGSELESMDASNDRSKGIALQRLIGGKHVGTPFNSDLLEVAARLAPIGGRVNRIGDGYAELRVSFDDAALVEALTQLGSETYPSKALWDVGYDRCRGTEAAILDLADSLDEEIIKLRDSLGTGSDSNDVETQLKAIGAELKDLSAALDRASQIVRTIGESKSFRSIDERQASVRIDRRFKVNLFDPARPYHHEQTFEQQAREPFENVLNEDAWARYAPGSSWHGAELIPSRREFAPVGESMNKPNHSIVRLNLGAANQLPAWLAAPADWDWQANPEYSKEGVMSPYGMVGIVLIGHVETGDSGPYDGAHRVTALKKLTEDGFAEIEFEHPFVGNPGSAGIAQASGIYFPHTSRMAQIQGVVDLQGAGWTREIPSTDGVFAYLTLEGVEGQGTLKTELIRLDENGSFDVLIRRAKYRVSFDRRPIVEPSCPGDPEYIDTRKGAKTGLVLKISP